MVSALSYKPFLLVLRSQFQSHEINQQTQNTFWETNAASGEQESNHGNCIIIFFVVNAWMARRVCVWSCRRTASDSLSSSQGHRNFLLWLMPWRNSESNLYGTQEPWEKMEKANNCVRYKEEMFFFTRLKRVSSNCRYK